ncbi:MAG: type VI secretion system baseplate subunit TssF [Gammaproteobacteria bacterium]|nr:type VI secretion system baseplate subunit TssF [Gammaproteobacteria bacterium]
MSFQSYFNAEMRALQQLYRDANYADPTLDRILEGVAHLTARVREQLDDDFPEIPAQILQQHWPFMLRDYASRSLMRFTRQTKTVLPKGSVLTSEPLGEEKTRCKFVTLQDITIYPIELLRVEIKNNYLHFYFESKQQNLIIPSLRLYLNTDSYTAMGIYYAVAQNLKLSYENSAQLWMDYFGFRESFLYLELTHVSYINGFFEARVPLKNSLPPNTEIKPEWFVFNTVPVVNEYITQSEPVLYKLGKMDYEITPDQYRPKSIVLQSLENLTHLAQKSIDYAWQNVKRYLVIYDNALKENSTLSCEITVTNCYYPHQYWVESKLSFMARPTPYLVLPKRRNYLWDVMRCLNIDLGKVDLVQIQYLFNWTSNLWAEKHCNAVLSLVQKPLHKIIKGVFYQGIVFEINIREENFRDISEMYLWGSVCHTFFKLITPFNTLIETIILAKPSSRILTWA